MASPRAWKFRTVKSAPISAIFRNEVIQCEIKVFNAQSGLDTKIAGYWVNGKCVVLTWYARVVCPSERGNNFHYTMQTPNNGLEPAISLLELEPKTHTKSNKFNQVFSSASIWITNRHLANPCIFSCKSIQIWLNGWRVFSSTAYLDWRCATNMGLYMTIITASMDQLCCTELIGLQFTPANLIFVLYVTTGSTEYYKQKQKYLCIWLFLTKD